MNSWKPESYDAPVASDGRYVKFKKGDNRFRVLSAPIMGYKYFKVGQEKSKVVRVRSKSEVVHEDIKPNSFNGKKQADQFWAMAVWDYQNQRVSILDLTQITLLQAFDNYTNDPDFSDPTEYDIVITKTVEGDNTKYSFRNGKHSPITDVIKKAYLDTPVDLEKMFEEGGDPYEVDGTTKELQNTVDVPFNPGE